jgi:D-glycero-alpha-D-manno-heptose 1-phosphate guanylyltransferase
MELNTMPTAVILAGGRGTRIAELYPETPKPLIPVCGQPFLHWITDWLVGQGITDIVYSIGYRAGQIQAWVERARPVWPARLRCRSEVAPLGTGGAVLECLELCGPGLLVVNGDSLTPVRLAPLLDRGARAGVEGVLLGVRMGDAARYGTLSTDAGGRLTAFAEKRPGAGIVNAGVYLLARRLLEGIARGGPLSMEQELLPGLIARGAHLAVEVAEKAPFLDIGTPESLGQAEAFVTRHRAGGRAFD